MGERAPDIRDNEMNGTAKTGPGGEDQIVKESRQQEYSTVPQENQSTSKKKELVKQGSILSNYFGSGPPGQAWV